MSNESGFPFLTQPPPRVSSPLFDNHKLDFEWRSAVFCTLTSLPDSNARERRKPEFRRAVICVRIGVAESEPQMGQDQDESMFNIPRDFAIRLRNA
jgi:hypothetical protein